MKRTIWIVAAMVLSIATFAQRPGRPMGGIGYGPNMENGREGIQQLFKELNLTDAQQKQMKTLNENFREKMKVLQEKEDISVKEQRDQMFDLGKQHRSEMKKVLTKEQQEKMNSLLENKRTEMQEKQAKHFEKMANELKLNETQKTQLKQQQEKNRKAMQALRENESLDRSAKENGIKNLMDQHRKDMAKVLTKEQMEQWEKMRQDRPNHKGEGKGSGHKGGGRGPHGDPMQMQEVR
jgi:Spy/CpxP family protein refolding chaperone